MIYVKSFYRLQNWSDNKYPERIVLEMGASTLMRIKQQYKVSSKRPVPRKRSTMAVDDTSST